MITAEMLKDLIDGEHLSDQPEVRERMERSFEKLDSCMRSSCDTLGVSHQTFTELSNNYINGMTEDLAANMQYKLTGLVDSDEALKGMLESDNQALLKEGMTRLIKSTIKDLIPQVMTFTVRFIYVTSDRTVSHEELSEAMSDFNKILEEHPKLLDTLIENMIENNSESIEQLTTDNG